MKKHEQQTSILRKAADFRRGNNFKLLNNYIYYLATVFFTLISIHGNAAEKVFDIFNRKSIAWFNGKQVKSDDRGFTDGTSDKPAELWFGPTHGKRKAYMFALKPITVDDCDFLLLEYLIAPGTYMTIDANWDGDRMRRILSYSPGEEKWQTLKLPVKGKKITMSFSVTDLGKDEHDLLRKVSFMPIKGIKENSTSKQKLYTIESPIIIPEPKEFQLNSEIFELIKNGNVNFGVCVNKKAIDLKKIILDELAEELNLNPEKIIFANNIDQLKPRTVIDLQLGDECKIAIPNKKEAYAIKSYSNNQKNIIILAAKDKAGLYWAWQTLRQMIINKNKHYSVSSCEITDWPDYEVRGFITGNLVQLKESLRWKSNVNTLPWWGRTKEWRHPSEQYKRIIETLTSHALARGCDINFWVCPFFYDPIIISNNDDIETLMNTHELSLGIGGRSQFLGIDDGGRKGESFVQADKKEFDNDILLAHAWYAKKLSDKIFKKYPDANIFMATKDYESAKGVKGYYDRIGVSKDIIIGWTGPQCVTFEYPKYIVDDYIKGIEGRRFMLCDNTPSQAHGMYRNLTICEKYGDGYEEIYKSGKCVGVKPNYNFDHPIRDIRALSIAEYMWNASRYNAEKARQRAIAKIAGNQEAVKPILKYADKYLSIAYKYPVDKRLTSKKIEDFRTVGFRPVVGWNILEDKELNRYSMEAEEYNHLLGKIADMNTVLQEIDSKCENKELTGQFHMLHKNLIEVITHIKENSTALPVIKPFSFFNFDMEKIPGGTHYKKRGLSETMSAALYGNQTAVNTFTVVFKMTEVPSGTVILKLNGWDCDKTKPLMVVKINGYQLYSGKTIFEHTYPYKTGPGKMEIKIPGKYFKKGRNELNIINEAPSSDMIDNWIVIGGISFIFL